jgi:hypothetical protein
MPRLSGPICRRDLGDGAIDGTRLGAFGLDRNDGAFFFGTGSIAFPLPISA